MVTLYGEIKPLLQKAKSPMALTGAGISKESGIPTFRGAEGLWRRFRAEELATPEAFAKDPDFVWEFYNERRADMLKASPNPAHLALADYERRNPQFNLITQNIDGLHQRAGSEAVTELHGNIWRIRCVRCSFKREERRIPFPSKEPCPECGERLRPDIVWFGEMLDPIIVSKVIGLIRSCDLLLVVGTSSVVQPAASFIYEAKGYGATLIEVNPEETVVSQIADFHLEGPAGKILPELLS